MKKITLLFVLLSSSLFSQKIIFKGTLLDKETKKPVAYANISFLKADEGISTIDDGTFRLKIDENLLNKQIHISCLNYKDTIVFAHQLYQKILLLQPKIVELNEIKIHRKVNREQVVDKYRRKNIKGGFSGVKGHPWIVTKFFKYKKEYKNTPYLKNVTVYFGPLLFRRKAKFRIRLFSVDKQSGKPLEDLISENIIITVKKLNGKITVDISKFDVEFPKEGFFVGLERLHIPSNFHKETYTMKGSKKKHYHIVVSPSFAATYQKNRAIWVHSNGIWLHHNFQGDYSKGSSTVPAISLTLSN